MMLKEKVSAVITFVIISLALNFFIYYTIIDYVSPTRLWELFLTSYLTFIAIATVVILFNRKRHVEGLLAGLLA